MKKRSKKRSGSKKKTRQNDVSGIDFLFFVYLTEDMNKKV
jgi:hypothetical protein